MLKTFSTLKQKVFLQKQKMPISGQNIWSKYSSVKNILYFEAKVFAQKQKHDHFWSKYSV